MKLLLLLSASLLLAVGADGWDKVHKFYNCHSHDDLVKNRMPANLDNLVALIEKWEKTERYKSPADMCNALIKRYQRAGVVYDPNSNPSWSQLQEQETRKQDLSKKLVSLFEDVPENMYDPREECALYRALSHSVDTYPFGGVDENWENNGYRRRRSTYSSGYDNQEYSKHPFENGVVRTPSGPIAAGTLFSGIMAMDREEQKSIQSLYPKEELQFMPDEMKSKSIVPLQAVTLAGDIGQSCLITKLHNVDQGPLLGDKGLFGNCTACPRQFSLARTQYSFLTRAEIFAGIDALLIAKAKSSLGTGTRLSQILRMYYSDLGLPGKPQYKSCNRMELFKSELDGELIKQQALHFMYAYSKNFLAITSYIEAEPVDEILRAFDESRNDGWNTFSSFVNGYNYEDFDACDLYSKDVPCQSRVDLVMVYGHEGGVTDAEFQKEFIAHLGQVLGVGEHRSRIGVMDGKSGNWLEPMTNFSNVADWGCNFTDLMTSGGSGSQMLDVIDKLTVYYDGVYKELNKKPETASAPAQVVLWYVGSNPNDQAEVWDRLQDFRYQFRDVYILMMGRSKGSFIDFLVDEKKDFFSVSTYTNKPEKMAKDVAKRICQVPSVFIYPSCLDPNSRESSHEYKNYLSPNRTTFMIINPYNFFTSSYLKLSFGDSKVRVCVSRYNRNPVEGAEETECKEAPTEFEYWNLCGGWMSTCKDIYVSVTAIGTGFSCNDEKCEYPNQIEYTMKHDGMICGSSGLLPSVLLLLAAMALHCTRS